ncbi:hypothetical protein AHMF7616_03511 [Adhaeribacter pallidiroseus]|uniref:Uncharacterized protein n=1 Tax=Adhaeribacter pallidiroseus TaxID=2072847 RepID=A0A369QPW2_9BACT|nr:hypothetical protein AHMF7616_03511 [Adhaeribacter pallidiroseus]
MQTLPKGGAIACVYIPNVRYLLAEGLVLLMSGSAIGTTQK